MSSSALKQTCKEIVEELKASANSAGAASTRRALGRQKGQILIINRTRFSKNLGELLPQLAGSKNRTLRDKVWTLYSQRLQALASRVPADRLKELQAFTASGALNLRSRDSVFYVASYRSAVRAKNTLLKAVISKVLKTANINYNDDDLRRVSGADNKSGAQLGHAETVNGQQVGYAASSARAARAKQMVTGSGGLASTEQAKLQTIIGSYETKMNMTLDHTQLYDENGKFRKDYIPVLSWQGAINNQELAMLEQAAIAALIKDFEDLANKPGSTTMKNGIAQITLNNVAGKKKKTKRVTGTRKKKVQDKGKGSSSGNVKMKRANQVARDEGIPASAIPAISSRRRETSSPSLVQLLGVLNERIEETVAKNMGDPRLNFQTGRFADSVRIVDINTTAQGFPSVGYTYQKYPYQTFEPGFAQGDPDRDPRKLIDVSIREIAAQYAMGRFYTRRV
jgi:hypothetical protein